jgi:hypothetical protein
MGDHIDARELEALAFQAQAEGKKVNDLLPAEYLAHAVGCEVCRLSVRVYDGIADADKFRIPAGEPVEIGTFEDARYQRS